MNLKIHALCLILAFSNVQAEEKQAFRDVPIGIDMAIQHYDITKDSREKLKKWPDQEFRGSPTEVQLDKPVKTLKQLEKVLEARPEKLKKQHRVYSIVEKKGFYVVVLFPRFTDDAIEQKYDGKHLHHAYLIPKNSSQLVHWFNW